LEIECGDVEGVGVADETHGGDQLLLPAEVEDFQLLAVGQILYVGAVNELLMFLLREALIEEVQFITDDHADHTHIDQLNDGLYSHIITFEFDFTHKKWIILFVLIELKGVEFVGG
jgi:hypothetical protein